MVHASLSLGCSAVTQKLSQSRAMQALLQLMSFASASVTKVMVGVHSIPVCEMSLICRSSQKVIVAFANHCHSGSGNDLAVGVGKFDPKVVCSPQPFPRDDSVLKACQAIVDQMETSKDVVIFAQQGVHSRLETPIPFYYYGPPKGSTEFLDKSP